MPSPEQLARGHIDKLLSLAGWQVQDAGSAYITAAAGVAVREFPLPGHGFADYLLYVAGKAAGIIEAKKAGATLSGVEVQSSRYTAGLLAGLPAWARPLPFAYLHWQRNALHQRAGPAAPRSISLHLPPA